MFLYLKKIKNKAIKLLLPRNRYLRYAWNNEVVSASWYKTVRGNPVRDLNREEYTEYIRSIGDAFKEYNSLGIDLGCGDFRVTEHLLKLFPDTHYVGIDFSDYAERAYNFYFSNDSRVNFIKSDITDIDFWLAGLKEKYCGYKIILFTYGALMYLSGEELSKLLYNLRNLSELNSVVSIEPSGKENLDSVLSRRAGDSYFHDYSSYFTQAGFFIVKCNYLFDKEYIFIVAKKEKGI